MHGMLKNVGGEGGGGINARKLCYYMYTETTFVEASQSNSGAVATQDRCKRRRYSAAFEVALHKELPREEDNPCIYTGSTGWKLGSRLENMCR